MIDNGSFCMSLICLLAAVTLILLPREVLLLSRALNRPLAVLDDGVIRHRYVIGLVLFGLSYSLFRLSLMIPSLWG